MINKIFDIFKKNNLTIEDQLRSLDLNKENNLNEIISNMRKQNLFCQRMFLIIDYITNGESIIDNLDLKISNLENTIIIKKKELDSIQIDSPFKESKKTLFIIDKYKDFLSIDSKYSKILSINSLINNIIKEHDFYKKLKLNDLVGLNKIEIKIYESILSLNDKSNTFSKDIPKQPETNDSIPIYSKSSLDAQIKKTQNISSVVKLLRNELNSHIYNIQNYSKLSESYNIGSIEKSSSYKDLAPIFEKYEFLLEESLILSDQISIKKEEHFYLEKVKNWFGDLDSFLDYKTPILNSSLKIENMHLSSNLSIINSRKKEIKKLDVEIIDSVEEEIIFESFDVEIFDSILIESKKDSEFIKDAISNIEIFNERINDYSESFKKELGNDLDLII